MRAESTYASRMRVRNKLRLLSGTETDIYTANKTTVV